VDWNEVGERDRERQAATRKLLAEGKLQTAKDSRFAAPIFQRSTDTAGYLLAHVLAGRAVGKGDSSSRWLDAATMGRYLHSLNQPQVFGTKFRQPEGVWAKEPFDRAQPSDAVRATWCGIPLAEQDVIEKGVREGKPVGGTQIRGCK